MRDLKADLEIWQNDSKFAIKSTDWFYPAGEYIERAIKAEEELQKQIKYHVEKTDEHTEIISRLNQKNRDIGEQNATLREENEKVWEELYNLREVNRRVCEQNKDLGEALTNCVTWFTSREVKACFGLCNAHRGFEVSREFSESAQKTWDKAKALAGLEGDHPCPK